MTEEEVGVVVAALDVLGRQMAALYDLAAQLHFASKVRPLSRPLSTPLSRPYLALIASLRLQGTRSRDTCTGGGRRVVFVACVD
jgi:hypothetical protein